MLQRATPSHVSRLFSLLHRTGGERTACRRDGPTAAECPERASFLGRITHSALQVLLRFAGVFQATHTACTLRILLRITSWDTIERTCSCHVVQQHKVAEHDERDGRAAAEAVAKPNWFIALNILVPLMPHSV